MSMIEEIEAFEHRLGLRMAPNAALVSGTVGFRERRAEEKEELRRIGVASHAKPRRESILQFYEFAPDRSPGKKGSPGGKPRAGKDSSRRNVHVPELPIKTIRDVNVVTARSAAPKAAVESRTPLVSQYYQDPILMSPRRPGLGRTAAGPKEEAKSAKKPPPFEVSLAVKRTVRTPMLNDGATADQPASAYQKAIDDAREAREAAIRSARESELRSLTARKQEAFGKAAERGEPFVLKKIEKEQAERSRPLPKQVLQTLHRLPREEAQAVSRAIRELDDRHETIVDLMAAEKFKRDSEAEDSRRLLVQRQAEERETRLPPIQPPLGKAVARVVF